MAETKATVLLPSGQIALRTCDLRHGFRYRLRRALNKIFGPSNVAGELIVDTPLGRHTLSYRRWTSDEGVALQMFDSRDYDVTKLRRYVDLKSFLDRIHSRGQRPLIIDAGANIGLSSVFFAMHFPTALVVAVEPEGKNFDVLRMNATRFNIECVKAAISSQTGRARVTDPGRGDWGYQTEPAADGDVPSVTINSLYQRYAKDRIVPFIVKIDIEGGEKDLCFIVKSCGWFPANFDRFLLLMLLPLLWACGQRACVVHHVHSETVRWCCGFVDNAWSSRPSAQYTKCLMPETATGRAACRSGS